MTAKELIKKEVRNCGITLAELSRRTGIPYHRVRRTIDGESTLTAKDFVIYCKVLNVDIR